MYLEIMAPPTVVHLDDVEVFHLRDFRRVACTATVMETNGLHITWTTQEISNDFKLVHIPY